MLNPYNYSKSLLQSFYGWAFSPVTSWKLLDPGGKDQGVLLVLCYHRIVRTLPERDFCDNYYYLNLPEKIFISQIKWLIRHYRVVSLDEVLSGRTLPPRAALITFDDGFMNTYETAFPFLKLNRLPATVFLIGSVLREGKAPWIARLHRLLDRAHELGASVEETLEGMGLEPDTGMQSILTNLKAFLKRKDIDEISAFLQTLEDKLGIARTPEPAGRDFMGERQVRELCSNGWTVGNHTDNHLNLASLRPERVEEEIRDAQETLSVFSGYRKVLAVPFGIPGSHTSQTIDLARSGCIDLVFTALSGLNRSPVSRTVIDRVICETFSRSYFRLIASGGKKSLQSALSRRR